MSKLVIPFNLIHLVRPEPRKDRVVRFAVLAAPYDLTTTGQPHAATSCGA